MRSRSIFHFLAAISLSTSTAVYAGPISGRVVDPDGRAVPGAEVLLSGDGAALHTARSNARGEFVIVAPDSGRFELRVALDGFRADAVAVDGSAEGRDLGAVKLDISAVSESLVVSAAQVELPLSQASSAVTVITGAELQARQVTTVADALRQVPGFTVTRSGGPGALTMVFPRGGESDYTLVFIDGIQQNAFGGGFDFAHLSTANVDRVEVVRGPQSALYGSNANRRRRPHRDEGRRTGTRRRLCRGRELRDQPGRGFHERNRRRVVVGRRVDRLASNGFNGRTTAAGQRVDNDDYARTETGGNGGWRNAAGALVRGEVRFERDERGFPGPFGPTPWAFTQASTPSRAGRTTAGARRLAARSRRGRGSGRKGKLPGTPLTGTSLLHPISRRRERACRIPALGASQPAHRPTSPWRTDSTCRQVSNCSGNG